MSTDEYTPTTDEVRADYVCDHTRNHDSYLTGRSLTSEQEVYGDRFNRWLAARDAEVAERIAQAIEALPVRTEEGDQHDAITISDRAARIAREVGRSASTLHDAPPQDDDGLPPYRPVQRFGAEGGRLLPARTRVTGEEG